MGNPITLGGIDLRPAPFVSTSYEYERSGSYIIGGKLNVTLNGTIVGEDILSQINEINQLQSNTECMNLKIGCDGGSDFLTGEGKIVNISINRSDNSPFTATYSITIGLERVNNSPAVEADEEFTKKYNLGNVKYLKQFSESITVDGDGNILGYYDGGMNISKSYVKATGQISVASSTTAICGEPGFDGLQQSIDILDKRFKQLSNLTFSDSDHILSDYSGWSKWLDSKSVTVDEDGTVSCSFELYMTQGACQPFARIDITTDDRITDHQKTKISNRSISGTITGLSGKTTELLNNKTNTNERLSNATSAWSILQSFIANGNWPGNSILLSESTEGSCKPPECPPPENNSCYQRLSSNITQSPVNGEITFSAEFGPIDQCLTNSSMIETTVVEEFPVVRHREFIVPNLQRSIIQYLGDTPHKAIITANGALKNCNKDKMPELIQCVIDAFNKASGPFNGWIRTTYATNKTKYSYRISATLIKCDA